MGFDYKETFNYEGAPTDRFELKKQLGSKIKRIFNYQLHKTIKNLVIEGNQS